jgi:heptosyltransferase II
MNIPIIRIIDKYIVGAAISLLWIIKPLIRIIRFNKPKNNILCIQLWGIGETVLTLPAVEKIKNKYPKKKLSVLTTSRNSAVYEDQLFVDEIITINISIISVVSFIFGNFRKYEMVFDFEEYLNISSLIAFMTGCSTYGYGHGLRGAIYDFKAEYDDTKHVVSTFLDLARLIDKDAKDPNRLTELKGPLNFDSGLNLKENNKVIGICSGAAESGRSRIWSNYSELAERILKKDSITTIAFIGTLNEKESIDKIIEKIKHEGKNERIFNLAGRFTLHELFAFIKQCDLFISNDTGPMHIAAAQGVWTIGLFGPNLPERFGPYGISRDGRNNISIYKKTDCSPCINVHLGSIKECDNAVCMKRITVDDVMRYIN